MAGISQLSTRLLVTLLTPCLLSSACTVTRRLSVESSPLDRGEFVDTQTAAFDPGPAYAHARAPARLRDLAPGQTVFVTLRSGDAHRLRLDRFDAEAITGVDVDTHSIVSIAMAEVDSVHTRRFSFGRTAGLVFGVLLGGAVAWYCNVGTMDDCKDHSD